MKLTHGNNSLSGAQAVRGIGRPVEYIHAMEHLVEVLKDLSNAHDLETIQDIVRTAARELTGADGATFVLRDGDKCYYADENAIAPLWKGKRFPMKMCISGWSMEHKQPVLIKDIYQDPRIPADVYRQTFVKSMAMVPIRQSDPIGAIGNYWADEHMPSAEELSILQALADTTSVAIRNAELYMELQNKVKELEVSNHALQRFAWVASHDLQEPLRTIAMQLDVLKREMGDDLNDKALQCIDAASGSANQLRELVQALLLHAHAERNATFKRVDMGALMQDAKERLQCSAEEHNAQITIGPMPDVTGDPQLLTLVWQNLLSNAIKYHAPDTTPLVQVSCRKEKDMWEFCVSDCGIGIETDYYEQIFGLFQRLHTRQEYPGAGLGLATVKKVVELHGGKVWVKSKLGEGSAFYFTIPEQNGRPS